MRAFRTMLFLLVLGGTTSAMAQDAAPLDRKLLDQQVYGSLRTVINYGADLYNNRDAAGCYHVFRTACVMVGPLLDHRPDLQQAIRAGMADAEKDADMAKRAWILRKVLDHVRAGVKPDVKVEEKTDEKKPEEKKPEEKKPEEKEKKPEEKKNEEKAPDPKPVEGKQDETQSLWQRLGGEPVVKKVVDDWFELAANDPKVNLSRNGQFQPTPDQVDNLKKLLVAQISAASGGPLKYTGRDMKTAHKNMGITNEEFTAAADNLQKAMETNQVKPDVVKQLLKIVAASRKDIVER